MRPLESRRKKHVTIRLGANKDVIIRQHRTDVLTYRADDSIVLNNGGWASMTTHELINTVSPLYCTGHQNQTWIGCFFETPTGEKIYGNLPLRDNTPEEFKFNAEKNHWLRVNPLFPTVGTINRAAAKQVRGRYAKFTAYALGSIKLLGEGGRFAPEVFEEVLGEARGRYMPVENLQALMLSDDTADHFKALLRLLNPYSNHRELFPKTFNVLMLKLHAKEMVATREVYTGGLVVNKYKGYTG